MGQKSGRAIRRRVFDLLEGESRSGLLAWAVDCGLVLFIVLNIMAVILETVESIGLRFQDAFRAFNVISVAVFTIEYLIRLWASIEGEPEADRDALFSRLRYGITPLALIDLIAIAPFYLSFLVSLDLRFLRVLRILRVLKLTRYSSAITLLINVFRQEARAFAAALFILAIVLVFASAGIYLVEQEAQPEAFGSIPAAMWWAVATLTTVGYGDVTPVTVWGKVFGACVTIVGIGMVALPSGLLASGFSDQLRKRRAAYQHELQVALEDGVIDEREAHGLEDLRRESGLSDSEAAAIKRSVIRQPRHPELRHCPHCGRALSSSH